MTVLKRYTGSAWEPVGGSINPPACRVYNSAVIGTTSGTPLALTFNSERYDTDSMHSTSSNTGRITFTTAGLYLVFFTGEFDVNTTGYRQSYIRLNGSTPILAQSGPPSPTIGHQMNLAGIYKFAASDYVEVIVAQTSGGALNITSGSAYTPEFGATWVGVG